MLNEDQLVLNLSQVCGQLHQLCCYVRLVWRRGQKPLNRRSLWAQDQLSFLDLLSPGSDLSMAWLKTFCLCSSPELRPDLGIHLESRRPCLNWLENNRVKVDGLEYRWGHICWLSMTCSFRLGWKVLNTFDLTDKTILRCPRGLLPEDHNVKKWTCHCFEVQLKRLSTRS
jgi:hypothetical protein